MSQNKRNLSAFVRYDGTGRVIAGSLILQKNMPKDGNWKQTQAYLCCDPSCPVPVYNIDFVLTNAIDEPEALYMYWDTAPGVTMQVQFADCTTRKLQGPRFTIPAGSTDFETIFPTEAVGCALAARRVCGPNYNSIWIFD